MYFNQHIVIDGKEYIIEGTYSKIYVSDDFSHNFGIRRCGHDEVDDLYIYHVYLDDVEIVPVKSLEDDIKEKLMEVLI
jgi:hypothetical protein